MCISTFVSIGIVHIITQDKCIEIDVVFNQIFFGRCGIFSARASTRIIKCACPWPT